MVATEEKALEKNTVNDVAESIYKELQAWRNSTLHSGHVLNEKDFKEAVKWLKTWRERNSSGEEIFAALMLLSIASFVESDIERRFGKVCDKLLSALK